MDLGERQQRGPASTLLLVAASSSLRRSASGGSGNGGSKVTRSSPCGIPSIRGSATGGRSCTFSTITWCGHWCRSMSLGSASCLFGVLAVPALYLVARRW